jgi:hypothetical protein
LVGPITYVVQKIQPTNGLGPFYNVLVYQFILDSILTQPQFKAQIYESRLNKSTNVTATVNTYRKQTQATTKATCIGN